MHWIILMLLFITVQAWGETYVSLLGGYNFPANFSHFQGQYYAAHTQFEDDLKLQNGYTLSGKVGWSPARFDWLAVEIQALQSWPNQKQQAFTQFSRQGGSSWQVNSGTLAGTHWKMLSFGPNVLLRHRFEGDAIIYSGVGMPVFLGSSYGGSSINPSIGLDFLAGLKGPLTDAGHVRWTIEAHRLMAHQTYHEMDGAISNGFSGNYTSTVVLAGIELALW